MHFTTLQRRQERRNGRMVARRAEESRAEADHSMDTASSSSSSSRALQMHLRPNKDVQDLINIASNQSGYRQHLHQNHEQIPHTGYAGDARSTANKNSRQEDYESDEMRDSDDDDS